MKKHVYKLGFTGAFFLSLAMVSVFLLAFNGLMYLGKLYFNYLYAFGEPWISIGWYGPFAIGLSIFFAIRSQK